jgi:hypothetical protein
MDTTERHALRALVDGQRILAKGVEQLLLHALCQRNLDGDGKTMSDLASHQGRLQEIASEILRKE